MISSMSLPQQNSLTHTHTSTVPKESYLLHQLVMKILFYLFIYLKKGEEKQMHRSTVETTIAPGEPLVLLITGLWIVSLSFVCDLLFMCHDCPFVLTADLHIFSMNVFLELCD